MIYRSLLRPILFRLPPETAHDLALRSLSFVNKSKAARSFVASRSTAPSSLEVQRFGLTFANPIGLAAGFDKNGTAAQGLATLGFGFIEVGTVTREAQPGNPKPRIFRLPKDRALINRLGFNNCGAVQLARNLKRHRPDCVLGVNIGKSRSVTVDEAIPDYLATFETIYEAADYIAINVSSPNTPGLRELQRPQLLIELLRSLQKTNEDLATRSALPHPKPLLLKIAPDLFDADLAEIIDVATAAKVSGIIATNTTISRAGLKTSTEKIKAIGEGGLSGGPLCSRANEIIAWIYQRTGGTIPIVGVGGVFTAEDAWQKICAGASLIQVYTGFVYEGPGIARRINDGLVEIMKREGLESLDQAVGSRVREEKAGLMK